MFRLAHLSDVHLGPLPPVARRELMSKRITGYINWQRNRAMHHDAETVARLTADIAGRRPDHLAITGDLINLGLDAEIETAVAWLESLGDPATVSLVCGNHDAYVPGTLDRVLERWQRWITDDKGRHIDGPEDFPVLRRRGRVSLIGCNSARATMPFLATGYFRGAQARALGEMLAAEGRAGQCRVVLIHHPPVRWATAFHKRLVGAGLFRRAIARHGAELVLHGHTHRDSVATIAGAAGPVPVVGVPSAGESGGRRHPASRYNLFNIAEGPRGWSIAMQEYGLGGAATPIGLIAKRQLA
ncbi:MAG: metallophosphatase [Alphaproteobacteria bacterium]|nr:MAG: metallophosphatase [Alphaproteobacteria bacterium]